MHKQVAAVLLGFAAGVCFWLAWVVGLAGEPGYSTQRVIIDTFNTFNPMSGLLVGWAGALASSLLFRNRSPRIALAFKIASPTCGILASASEIWALQQAIASLDFPAGEAMWLYVPRLTAASLALAVTLLGLSLQLLLTDERPRWGRFPDC
jgi:hypothetical protein